MDRKLFNAVLRTDFYSFVRRVFREIAAGETLVENWHIEAMCFALSQVAMGYRRRQIIEVPPRSLKSMCASVALTAWILGHNPTRKIICVSYSQILSGRFSAMTRQVMKSDWYKDAFPGTRISAQKDTEEYFRTTAGGYRDATSVGGTLTGKGGDLIIIDDPAKPDEMMSEAQRNAVNNWYDRTLVSRLNNKAKDAILLVMQRLHPDDLAGHVKEGEPWDVLKLPAIATIQSQAQIGKERWHFRAEGDVLNPAHEPLEELLRLRERMGSNAFSAQYQQDPLPADGSIVEWAWFRRYDRLPSDMRIVQSGNVRRKRVSSTIIACA